MKRSRVLVLLAMAVLALAFFALGAGSFLNLNYLQSSQSNLAALYATHPWGLRAAFFLLYLAVAALSMPGAAILTLAGGAVFGLGWGLLLVSFASTLGATVSFWLARFVLRDAVQARFGQRLADINRGLAREGAVYLLSLRLIPVVPFFLINLAMGLTTLRAWTFYWVSQLGMLPATAVYVNAGTQLARIHTLGDAASPVLLGSLALLGLLPIVARRAMRVWRQRRLLGRWKSSKPASFDTNLVVIGAGAAGLVTAYIAAAVNARVTLVEAKRMGGDCLNFGCVPSKALIRSATLAHQMRHASRYGLADTEPVLRFPDVMQRIQARIEAIAPHDSVERYTALGVDVLQGHARIVNPWSVEVALHDGSTRCIRTRSIVIAAGASPVIPSLPGLEELGYVTSDTVWERFAQLDAAPRQLAILGAGPIGCELAQAFARLGCKVVLVEAAANILAREDAEVRALVSASLQADGVTLLTGHLARRCEWEGDTRMLVLEHDGAETRIGYDQLLCAVGRRARLSGYGLEALGIPASATVQTNEYLQTIYPNIYAAGDVAGPYQLTHAAAHQAWYAAINALFGDIRKFKVDYRIIPATTFTDPEVARVGLNEQDAAAKGIAFEVTRFPMAGLDRAIVDDVTSGFVKVLTVPGRDRILGVTIVGAHAGELLAEYVLAMKHGLGLNKVLGTVHSYPTLAEANKQVAGEWRRAHRPTGLLQVLRKFHDWRRGNR